MRASPYSRDVATEAEEGRVNVYGGHIDVISSGFGQLLHSIMIYYRDCMLNVDLGCSMEQLIRKVINTVGFDA